MNYQSKYCDIAYITTRLRDFAEIRKGRVRFAIHGSDRPESNSIYIDFSVQSANGFWYKEITMRISDHAQQNFKQVQFLISPNDIATKKIGERFKKTVDNCIAKSIRRNFDIDFKNLNEIKIKAGKISE